MTIFYQCLLEREDDPGHFLKQVAWIEERGAKPGAKVEVKEDGMFWDVVHVYKSFGLEEKILRDKQARDRDAFGSILPRKTVA